MVLTRSQSKTNFTKINNPYFNKKINKQKVINQKVIKQKVIKQKVIKDKDMRVNTFEIKQNTNIKENTVTDLENLCQAKKMEEFNQNILYHDERIKYFKLYINVLKTLMNDLQKNGVKTDDLKTIEKMWIPKSYTYIEEYIEDSIYHDTCVEEEIID